MQIFSIDGYKELINGFLVAGYSFEHFNSDIPLYGKVLLRHDIDFSINYALEIAKIEKEMGVISTFFFMINNVLYNPLATENYNMLAKISDLGHSVCLHVDENNIANEDNFCHLLEAIRLLMPFFDPHVVSRHRPNLDSNVLWLPDGVLETYQTKFFKDIEYASDSKGMWQFGYPTSRESFLQGKSFQLLTHPIWWVTNGDCEKKLSKMLADREYAGAKSIRYLKNN